MLRVQVVFAFLLLLHSILGQNVEAQHPLLTPYDPTLEVAVHEYTEDGHHEASQQLTIYPRRQVPQVRHIYQPGAVLMAVNVREIALLPGDRVVIRDTSNSTRVVVAASNQSIARRVRRRPRPILWNNPFLMVGDRVVIEYWPSLTTLVLPIDRKQLDNAALVVDSFTYGFLPWRRPRVSDAASNDAADEDEQLESTIGLKNEMKPAICYKSSEPQWYNKARSVARLMIQRPLGRPRSSPNFAAADGAVGGADSRDQHNDNPVGTGSWTFCTGWLVGRGNHMLTNYHCFFELTGRSLAQPQASSLRRRNASDVASAPCSVSSSASASGSGSSQDSSVSYMTQATVNFMAESKTCNFSGKTGQRAGEIDATSVDILAASESLDYCLLRLVPSANGSEPLDLAKKFGYLTLRESGPADGEAIYIPQHPNGEPKAIASVKDGKPATIHVTNSTSSSDVSGSGTVDLSFANVSVWYDADTAPGSSGSPVISQRDNVVVALHHAGTGARGGGSGQSTGWYSRLVDLVRGDRSDAGREGEYNVGIRIDAIVADMKMRRVLPPCAIGEKCDMATAKGKTGRPVQRSVCCEMMW